MDKAFEQLFTFLFFTYLTITTVIWGLNTFVERMTGVGSASVYHRECNNGTSPIPLRDCETKKGVFSYKETEFKSDFNNQRVVINEGIMSKSLSNCTVYNRNNWFCGKDGNYKGMWDGRFIRSDSTIGEIGKQEKLNEEIYWISYAANTFNFENTVKSIVFFFIGNKSL